MRNGIGLLVLASAACGYTDGGGGSHTLEVVARLHYSTENNEMEVSVRVDKDALPLDHPDNGGDCRVKLTDDESGDVFDIGQVSPGAEFVANHNFNPIGSYHRRMKLLVETETGNHRVEGQLEGPGPHLVVSPKNGETFTRSDLGDELEVKWETEDGIAAEEATITVQYSRFTHTIPDYEDPGHFAVPSDKITRDNDWAHVIRTNKVRLDGGVGESRMEISYDASNQFIVTE